MTPDSVILIQLCLFALALFTALHFAWQANYYKLEADRASDIKRRAKVITKAIEFATENGRDDLVLKLRGQA